MKLYKITLAISALCLAVAQVHAKSDSELDTAYEGAPSGIDPSKVRDIIDSEGPEMTKAEFEVGKKIFFERCAGCHGVLRKGATGKPLTTDITRSRGDAALKAFTDPASFPSPGQMRIVGANLAGLEIVDVRVADVGQILRRCRALDLLDLLNMPLMDPEQYLIADEECILDVSKGERELGWVPQYRDEDMLNAAYSEYRAAIDGKAAAAGAHAPAE